MSLLNSLFGSGDDAAPPGPVSFAGLTDIGCKRKQNQDAWGRNVAETVSLEQSAAGLVTQPGWVVVADGMGGAKGGDVASRRAIEIVGEVLNQEQVPAEDDAWALSAMESALRHAHGILEAEASADSELRGMGCTFSGLWWPTDDPHRAVFGQVGDSRVYRWRDGQFTQLTRDQTVVQRLIDDGSMTPEQAAHAKFSSVLEFALGGGGGDLEPEIAWLDLQPGDHYLICSDGLCGFVPDNELARLLPRPGKTTRLSKLCDQFIQAARAKGGPDNITAAVIRINS